MKRSSFQQLKLLADVQGPANSDIGLASVQKGIEDNATTKGTIDVQRGPTTAHKGLSL